MCTTVSFENAIRVIVTFIEQQDQEKRLIFSKLHSNSLSLTVGNNQQCLTPTLPV